MKRHAHLLEFHITLNIVPERITRCFIVWFDHMIFCSSRESIDMDSRNVSGSQDAHEQTRYPLLSHNAGNHVASTMPASILRGRERRRREREFEAAKRRERYVRKNSLAIALTASKHTRSLDYVSHL